MIARIIFCLMSIPGLAHGAGLNELYSSDYEAFWKQWREIQIAAIECSEAKKMAEFLSSAVETLRNAEVSETNAKEIEATVISDAECVLNGLLMLNEEQKRKVIGAFLVNPLFASPPEIESSLSLVWESGDYSELRGIYERASKDR